MKNLRKILALALVLTFAVALLTACNGGGETVNDPAPPVPSPSNNETAAPEVVTPPASPVEPTLTAEERAIAAAEEFLSERLSLFGYVLVGVSMEGDFVHGDFPELLFSFSWIDYNPVVVDRTITEVRDVPFVISNDFGSFVAESFSLYDFNDDGIPEILIEYVGMSRMDFAWFSVLYQYIDGSYQPVWDRDTAWQNMGRVVRFLTTADGDVIAHINRLHFDTTGNAYYRLNFVDGKIEMERIAEYGLGWGFDFETDEEFFVGGGTNYLTGAQFEWYDWEHYIAYTLITPRTVPGAPDMILTPTEPNVGLYNQITAAIIARLTGGEAPGEAAQPPDTATPPSQGAIGAGLVGRWDHDSGDGFIEFFADGTAVAEERGQREELTWSTENGLLRTVYIEERDLGEVSVRFQQSLDERFGVYWTGYWIHFERFAFAASEIGGFRYKHLDGRDGEIYGRWADTLVNIQGDIASFEILPNGTGNIFPGAGPGRPNPDPDPFTWRIENGRFIRTRILDAYINYSIEGNTLTIYEIGDGWEDIDTFTRAG